MFVNAIMYYKVANAIHAVANVDDYSGSARLLAATTLRNVLGTLTLGDILCNRESIAKEMKVFAYYFHSVRYSSNWFQFKRVIQSSNLYFLFRVHWMREQSPGA